VAERILGERYRIVRHLARGGMAEVFLGRDELLGRTVAIKVLFPELASDPSFVERFRREARSAAGLNHHNIVSVYDFGEDAGSYYIVMEYVDGVTLRDVIRQRGPMDPAEAVRIATAVATALAVAHAQGTVHRDVKPANVLIAGGDVKVADFGIARAAADASQGLTQPGMVLGTARYLSPEQARGGAVDTRSDLYSLGMVLYEMLAGGPPFPGRSPVEVATRQLRETPPPPSSHNPRVSPALDALVAKAMSLDPAARHGSAEDLRAALVAVAAESGDPDATVAVAGPEATRVAAAGPATAVLPPVAPPPDVGGLGSPAVSTRRSEEAAYRRRRAVVIGVILALVLGLVVVLSQMGGSGEATVPEVVGLSVADASSALERAGLEARVVQQDRPGAPRQVLDQSPKGGVEVDRGSTVSLFVAGGAATTTAPPATTTTAARATTTTAEPTTTTARSPTTTSAAPATTVPTPTSAAPPTTRSTTS